jgi:predicted RNA-binding Zn-ribbon protein involved in translation (DUF1610 family)
MPATLYVVLFLVWILVCFYTRGKSQEAVLPLKSAGDMKCPNCKSSLALDKMLDGAIFTEPGAIVFDCPACNDRVYFSPYEDRIEIGILACAPVINPIPVSDHQYPAGSNLATTSADGYLYVVLWSVEWKIPTYRNWSGEKKARASKRHI